MSHVGRDLLAAFDPIAGPSVVEVMNHLRFIQRQVLRTVLAEHVARRLPTVSFEVFARVETMGVVRHVEHCAESDAPRVLLGLAVPGFPDQHRHTAIDDLGEFGIPARPEDGARTGVGVEEGNVVGRESEAAFGVGQRLDAVGEEDKLGSVSGGPQSTPGGEQAELVVPVDVGKEDSLVLEVEEAGERSRLHHVLKEELGRVVSGDAGGEYAASAAALVQDAPHGLGEDSVDIDVTTAAKGIPARVAQQMAPAVGRAQCVEKMPVKQGVVRPQGLDHPLAGGRIWSIRDLGTSFSKPFLFLELHPFPRRVSEYAIEAAFLEYFGEREAPVEELVLAGKALDFVVLCGCQRIGVGFESSQRVGRDALRGVAAGWPRLDEGGTPGVGDSLALAVGR